MKIFGSSDLQEIQYLIKQGASINQGDYDRRTPLHLATCEGHLDVVKFLLEQGANPFVVDRWGGTPLKDAIRQKVFFFQNMTHSVKHLLLKKSVWSVFFEI